MERFRANVYIDREVRDRAKELADRMGLSFSAFVNIALYEYLKQSSVIHMSDILRRVLDREVSGIKEAEGVPKA
jgi:hypothetical protein